MSIENLEDLSESISANLLRRLQDPDLDQAAWSRLVALYGPLVYRWCRRWQVPADDAPDIVQDVFRSVAAAVRRFSRHNPGSTFRGWLWTISRNAVRRYAGRHQQDAQGTGGTDHLLRLHEVPENCEDDPSFESESVLLLRSALDTIRADFESHTWEVFWRSAVLGHATADIAEDHSMTCKAVRQARYRVLKRLREECAKTFLL
ncbi:MAG: sigma-70 family RNA polymerase sigma factor [Planctomycetaceae bacterium]